MTKRSRRFRAATRITKLVYFSYGILDRQSDAVSFYCEPCIPPFPLLRLDNACPFAPAALSVAGGRTNTKKARLKLSYPTRSATVIEKLIIKERSICFIIIQMDQIAEIHPEAAILAKRHLTSADALEQADVPPEVVIVVVTADRPVPKGPWVPEAVPDRRAPSAPEDIPALRAP